MHLDKDLLPYNLFCIKWRSTRKGCELLLLLYAPPTGQNLYTIASGLRVETMAYFWTDTAIQQVGLWAGK